MRAMGIEFIGAGYRRVDELYAMSYGMLLGIASELVEPGPDGLNAVPERPALPS